jgi:uracil-DNA glycosylase family 4
MSLVQTSLFDDYAAPVEGPTDPLAILQELAGTCTSCRLGQTTDKTNEGVTYTGSPNARLAVLGDMPEVAGTLLSKRKPIAGEPLSVLKAWLGLAGLHEEDIFFINAVQCKTGKGKAKDQEVRDPFNEEIDACFPFRALRVLQAMPKLEVVMTLGWIAGACLVGRVPEPKQKSHEGQWFGTDLLPGVAVFCLDHPREFCGKEVDGRRIGKLKQEMEFFRAEYVNPETSKIMNILRLRQMQRAQTKSE